ncbi:glutamine synthetase [Mangrovimicrobium sediminis]|uniref:Glutamine synthetase n=1 Tax=Mangrovimicrobium sediminis TaxID=2562682 RepID=A0A4Z0LWS9_9GAMM|nr:glutamine synthetase family protein [Haliea sp. SAOS-164]TGD71700.1 glutamine synthetase [Haliea sp. SAOS-164]
MADNEQLLQAFLEENPDIEMFEVMLLDLGGNLRGKWVTPDKMPGVMAGQMKLPLTTLALDAWGRDIEDLVFDKGDGDGYCVPDPRTLAAVPWMARPGGQVLVSMHEVDGGPCGYDPRAVVERLMQRLASHGYRAVMATEMEFNLLKDERDFMGRPAHSQEDSVGGSVGAGHTYGIESMQEVAELMHEIRDACDAQGLPIDTLTKEAAPSQYEINLYHNDDALVAADQAVMLQRLIRGVARNHDLLATFMAKPFGDIAGNGMHVHCSLLDADGNNAFDDGTGAGTPLLRQAVAGCLETMPDCMLLLAPSLNSYRRFTRGTHAPLTPCWGYENRTVALRVPADAPAATRLEHRVAGADANPYLVIAGLLAGIVHGIERGLEPPEPLAGNAYEQLEPSLPQHWSEAFECFRDSAFITDTFGHEFQDVYCALKQQEMDEFDHHVTPLEYDAGL